MNVVIYIASQSKSSKDLWNAVNTVTVKNVTSDSTLPKLNCSEMNNYLVLSPARDSRDSRSSRLAEATQGIGDQLFSPLCFI